MFQLNYERIVSKLLRKDKDERYHMAKELLIDFKSLQKRLAFEAEFLQESEKEKERERDGDVVSSNISSSQLPPNNLTPNLSPIIGREREIAEIKGLLSQNDVRLLTMTGVGGTGKTTLAQFVGAGELPNFQRRRVFCRTRRTITWNPELVASTIAKTLDVKEKGGKPVLEILERLSARKTVVTCS